VVSEAQQHRALIAQHDAKARHDADAAAAAERNSPATLARERAAGLAQLESEISYNHAMIARLQAMMADERSAGRISGYVDARKLHDDGYAIVVYQRKMSAAYADYRSRGGRKTMAQIFSSAAPHAKSSLFVNLPKAGQ
jgi:hypothetical protein